LIFLGENAISHNHERYVRNDKKPLVQDWRAFLKAQPLVCDRCGMFTDIYREYCESCGATFSLRKSKKKDFIAYMSKRESQKEASDFVYTTIQSKIQEKKSIPRKSEVTNVETFIKEHPYICVFCWEFSINETAYCVNCGSKNSLRKAKKKFFSEYQERRDQYVKSFSLVQIPLSKPVLDVSQSEFAQESKSTTGAWKEKVKDIPTPPIPEISQPKPTEKIIHESIHKDSEQLKSIPPISIKEEEEEIIESNIGMSKPEEIVEKPKQIISFCKFCGLQLAELDKFCQQCGYIIKQK
jgi:predicted amidophosphoribosyltransferase